MDYRRLGSTGLPISTMIDLSDERRVIKLEHRDDQVVQRPDCASRAPLQGGTPVRTKRTWTDSSTMARHAMPIAPIANARVSHDSGSLLFSAWVVLVPQGVDGLAILRVRD